MHPQTSCSPSSTVTPQPSSSPASSPSPPPPRIMPLGRRRLWSALEVADDVAFKNEREISDPPLCFSSSSPIGRRRARHAHPASISQPPLGASDAVWLATPGNDAVVKRRRGRPWKCPAPQENADSVLPGNAQSASDSAPRPPMTRSGNRGSCSVASMIVAAARKRAQPRPPTPEDIQRVNRKLRALVL